MNKVLCCVFDSAAGWYLDPFVVPTIEVAIREFRAAVNNDQSPFNKYPGDYTLFKVGEWSAETGMLQSENPVSLGVGVEFLTKLELVDNG